MSRRSRLPVRAQVGGEPHGLLLGAAIGDERHR